MCLRLLQKKSYEKLYLQESFFVYSYIEPYTDSLCIFCLI